MMSIKSMLLMLFIAKVRIRERTFVDLFLFTLICWSFSFFLPLSCFQIKMVLNNRKVIYWAVLEQENLCIKNLLTIKLHRIPCSLFYTNDFPNFVRWVYVCARVSDFVVLVLFISKWIWIHYIPCLSPSHE